MNKQENKNRVLKDTKVFNPLGEEDTTDIPNLPGVLKDTKVFNPIAAPTTQPNLVGEIDSLVLKDVDKFNPISPEQGFTTAAIDETEAPLNLPEHLRDPLINDIRNTAAEVVNMGANVIGGAQASFGEHLQNVDVIKNEAFSKPLPDMRTHTGLPGLDITTNFLQSAAESIQDFAINNKGYITLPENTGIPVYDQLASISNRMNERASETGEGFFTQAGEIFKKAGETILEMVDKSGGISEFNDVLSESAGRFVGSLPAIVVEGLPVFMGIEGGAEAVKFGDSLLKGMTLGGVEGLALHGTFYLLNQVPRIYRVPAGSFTMGTPSLINELQKEPQDRNWIPVVTDYIMGAGLTLPGPSGVEYKAQFIRDFWRYNDFARNWRDARQRKAAYKRNLKIINKEFSAELQLLNPKELIDKLAKEANENLGISYDKASSDITKILYNNTLSERIAIDYSSPSAKAAKKFNKYLDTGELIMKEADTPAGRFIQKLVTQTNGVLKEITKRQPDVKKVNDMLEILELNAMRERWGDKLSDSEKSSITDLQNKIKKLDIEGLNLSKPISEGTSLLNAILNRDTDAVNTNLNKLKQRAINSAKVSFEPMKDFTINDGSAEAFAAGYAAIGNNRMKDELAFKLQKEVERAEKAKAEKDLNTWAEAGHLKNLYQEALDIANGVRTEAQVSNYIGPGKVADIKRNVDAGFDVVALESAIGDMRANSINTWMENVTKKEISSAINYLEGIPEKDVFTLRAIELLKKNIESIGNTAPKKPFWEMTVEEKINSMANDLNQDAVVTDGASGRVFIEKGERLNSYDWLENNRRRLELYEEYSKAVSEMYDRLYKPDTPNPEIKINTLKDYFDVANTLKRIGANETAEAIKLFEDMKNVIQIEELKKYEDLLKLIPKEEMALNELVLAVDNIQSPLRKDSGYSEAIKFMENWFKEKGTNLKEAGMMKKDWKTDAIDKLVDAIERTTSETKKAELKRRLEKVKNTSYVHIPIDYWFNKSLEKKNPYIYRIVRDYLKSRTDIDRKTISITDLVEKGILDIEDISMRDVFASYVQRYADDMAKGRIYQAAIKEGLITEVGKRKPGYKKAVGKVLKGRQIHPALEFQLDYMQSSALLDNRYFKPFKYGMAYIKMGQFINPIVMPTYDLYQMSAVTQFGGWKNLYKAAKAVRDKNDDYLRAMNTGSYSKPFSIYEKDYFKMLERAEDKGTKNFLKRFKRMSKNPIDNVMQASWEVAWKMDEVIRTSTFLTLEQRGYTAKEAGQITGLAHGDYNSVPKKTRQNLNLWFFTPTFKIAMAKAHYEAMRGVADKIGGIENKKSRAMAKAIPTAFAIQMSYDMFMTHFMGFKREHFGYKYVKEFVDEGGRKEIVVTTANPLTSMTSELYRVFDALEPQVDSKMDKFLGSQTSKMHPIYRVLKSAVYNVDMAQQPELTLAKRSTQTIRKPVESYPLENWVLTAGYIVRELLPILKVAQGAVHDKVPEKYQKYFYDTAKEKRLRGELEQLSNQTMGWLNRLGQNFVYERVPKDERIANALKKAKNIKEGIGEQIRNFGVKDFETVDKVKMAEDLQRQIEELDQFLREYQLEKEYFKQFEPR